MTDYNHKEKDIYKACGFADGDEWDTAFAHMAHKVGVLSGDYPPDPDEGPVTIEPDEARSAALFILASVMKSVQHGYIPKGSRRAVYILCFALTAKHLPDVLSGDGAGPIVKGTVSEAVQKLDKLLVHDDYMMLGNFVNKAVELKQKEEVKDQLGDLVGSILSGKARIEAMNEKGETLSDEEAEKVLDELIEALTTKKGV